MQRILVTGGLGYIGSHTVLSLLEKGYEVCIIDNLHNSERKVLERLKDLSGREIPFRQADMRDPKKLKAAIHELMPLDGTIHFAAHKSVSESLQHPFQYYQNNLTGMTHLCECLQEVGVHSFIFSSSCTVYGDPPSVPVVEDTPRQPPETPYGHTKILGEDLLQNLSRFTPMRAVALRYFNPIGAHPSARIGELPKGVPQNLVPFITQTAIGKRSELQIFGTDYPTPDGTAIRDYIHVCDLADAHASAMKYLAEHPDIRYDVFNIGTGRGASVLELVETFERVNELELPYTYADRRPGDVPEIYADPGKAERVLGWKARYTLEEALESAWRWERALAGK